MIATALAPITDHMNGFTFCSVRPVCERIVDHVPPRKRHHRAVELTNLIIIRKAVFMPISQRHSCPSLLLSGRAFNPELSPGLG